VAVSLLSLLASAGKNAVQSPLTQGGHLSSLSSLNQREERRQIAAYARYALEREQALRVFLEDPNVPLDTSHLERQIRAIALGRRNWLFCWTEVGARYVGLVQSLIASCRLQGVDPYVSLVDVLQRIDTHPAFEVHLLTPRLWKQHFAQNPLRSDLDRLRQ